jgi:hypothetical protein
MRRFMLTFHQIKANKLGTRRNVYLGYDLMEIAFESLKLSTWNLVQKFIIGQNYKYGQAVSSISYV